MLHRDSCNKSFYSSGDYLVLVLLDLTAAFDAVRHAIFVALLQHLVGICGSALDWFISYQADHLSKP